MKRGANLYKQMIQTQDSYRKTFIEFDHFLQEFFGDFCNEENSRIMIDEYNFITVRVSEKLPTDLIKKFKNDFDVKLLWERTEIIEDHRNIEDISATVYEYGFAANILLNAYGDDDD